MTEAFITTDGRREYEMLLTSCAVSHSGLMAKRIREPMLLRYFAADEQALNGVYIFIDDDIIPSTGSALRDMCRILMERPEYGIIGLSWKRVLSEAERTSSWVMGEDRGLLEMHHVGGAMAIRKGCYLKSDCGECDYPNGIGDDRVICEAVRKSGYRVGLYTDAYFHHLGEGNSTVWH